MTGKYLEEYTFILRRLENLDGATKKIIFRLMNIESKEALDYLAALSDEDLIEKLSDEEWLEQHN